MDNSKSLVAQLESKLTELDLKVWRYRSEMVAQFEKYTEDLLRDVSSDVSQTVTKSIADSTKFYKSLYPTAASPSESGIAGNKVKETRDPKPTPLQTPSPSIPHRMADEDEEYVRSPHEREKEFRGVFTPSYLPLLDSNNHNERRSSIGQPTSPPPREQVRIMDPLQVDASTDTRSLTATPEPARFPATPKRRNTDEASITSDASEGTIRRSALRRSSSSSKTHSPRRVRFEVAGEEVLPTASPAVAPLAGDTEDIPESSLDNPDEEVGASLLQEVESPPRPKRISSSQALRARSRNPPEDDGTVWTTVSAPPDGSPSVAELNGTATVSAESSAEDLDEMGGELRRFASANNRESAEFLGGIGAFEDTILAQTTNEAYGQEEGESDEDTLSMASKKSKKLVGILSPAVHQNIENNKSPTASTGSLTSSWKNMDTSGQSFENIGEGLKFEKDDQDDELFSFDEQTEQKEVEPVKEVEEDSDDTELGNSPDEGFTLSKYSQSPARSIIRPTALRESTDSPSSFSGARAESLRNHPFHTPIVSDEIHAQAAALGDIPQFVGSVDGRSGVDESNFSSFRASVVAGSFAGTPRSMSERLRLEGLAEDDEAIKEPELHTK